MRENSSVKVLELECPKHGVYIAFSSPSATTRCPSCVFQDQHAFHEPTTPPEQLGMRNVDLENNLRAVGVPERFLGARFSNYFPHNEESADVLQLLLAYVATFEAARADASNLVLLGQSGTGKTHLAVATLARLIERGLRVRYVDARKRIGFSVATRPPDLLVVDNIGENRSATQLEAVRNLLMDRYDAKLPTVLVGAVGRSTFESILSETVLDRLRDGGSKLIRCQWESYRRSSLKQHSNR